MPMVGAGKRLCYGVSWRSPGIVEGALSENNSGGTEAILMYPARIGVPALAKQPIGVKPQVGGCVVLAR